MWIHFKNGSNRTRILKNQKISKIIFLFKIIVLFLWNNIEIKIYNKETMKNCSKHNIIRMNSQINGCYQTVAFWAKGKEPDRS